jgi:5-formyltetrahydrofolate cyclo-ligase
MHGTVDIAARKAALRGQVRARRNARTTAELESAATRLADQVMARPDIAQARSLGAYVSVGAEPPTGPLLEQLRENGVRVLLPVVLDDLSLDWAEYTGADDLAPAGFGLLEPSGTRLGKDAIATVDAMIVPALSVDADGRRLGQGGGCYDRTLGRIPDSTPVVAVVFADEVLSSGELPEESFDRRVDSVIAL